MDSHLYHVATDLAGLQRIAFSGCPWSFTSKFSRCFEYLSNIATPISDVNLIEGCTIQLIFAEDLGHVFVQPFNFVAGRKCEVFCFLATEL